MAGADPSLVNRDGRSQLTLLAHVDDPCVTPNSLLNIVGLLLKYNSEINHKSLDEVTPLGAAVHSQSMPCVQMLIDAGADPRAKKHRVSWDMAGYQNIHITILLFISHNILDVLNHTLFDPRISFK